MDFILAQLQQFGMVILIMACAVGGTIGLLKLINHFTPGKGFSKDPVTKKLEEKSKKLNMEDQ